MPNKTYFLPMTPQFLPILNKQLTSPPLITLLKSCKTLKSFQQIHAQIIQKGLHNDIYLVTNFISRFFTRISIKNNKDSTFLLSYISSTFNSVTLPTTCLSNAFLKGQCDHSCIGSSLSILSAMRVSGFCPDKYTFPPLLKCCGGDELGGFMGSVIHGLVIKCGVEDDLFVGSSLVDFYGKCGIVGCAQNVFDGMSVRNVVSWTSLVGAYVHCGDMGIARRVFDEMPKRNQVSWNVMISGYVKKGLLDEAWKLFNVMPFKNVVSYMTLVDGYAKSGKMACARSLFEDCLEKDVFLWSALISGYVQNGQAEEAVELCMEMLKSNIRPDEYVMVSVMSACAQLGNMQFAREIDRYMSRSSFDLCRPHVVASLVDMNAKCGNMERALHLFRNMPNRDVISYCSLIQGYSIHGQGANAVKLFYDMLSDGIAPDTVAFTVILSACSHARLVEEAYCIFDMMKNKYSLPPSPNHYACMVDLLGRCGHLGAAYDLLQSLPVELNAEAWGALLGACRLHCDAEMGELVAQKLVEAEPHNASNFVLLSNIYAAADRWVDVSKIRDQMESRGLVKIAGRSLVE